MKKIIILMFYVFLLTGCSAHYELVYEDGSFNESLKIISNKSENLYNDINLYYKEDYIVDYTTELGDMNEKEYITQYGKGYNKELIDEDNNYGFKLGYTYDIDRDYNNSSIVHALFSDFFVSENFIKANNINNIFEIYPYLNEIKISFKSNNEVIESNADEYLDDTYYWYINKNNYSDKNIYINYKKEEKLITEDGYLSGSSIKYILMFLFIIILITIPIIYEKIRKSNI